MREEGIIQKELDWLTVIIYYILVIMGWLNIYAAIQTPEMDQGMFDIMGNKAGTQFLWISISSITIFLIMAIDFKVYFTIPYLIYGLCILSLILVLLIGVEIKGNQSWIKIGSISLQPSEFAKLGVTIAIAKYLSDNNIKFTFNKGFIILLAIIFFPAVLILLQPDTGSTLVFSTFIIVLYLEGLPAWIPGFGLIMIVLFILALIVKPIILSGIALGLAIIAYFILPKRNAQLLLIGGALAVVVITSFGTQFFIKNVLQEHQQSRINALIDPESDPKGAGWNVIQSKIAISDGGLWGKGFTNGMITKGNFVPEQHTDFIFCTIGEEHGFVGTSILIGLYLLLLIRLMYLSGRQKAKFVRIYGYSVTSIFFFHFAINIGMTIGLFPVIGIPLPFFSYGGSSLWAFSILLFIFLKLDMHRNQMLARN